VATTRSKIDRTRNAEFRCAWCGKIPRSHQTKAGQAVNPLFLVQSPSGKPIGKVCQLCWHVLKANGYKLFGPGK
jgi:hypothetical protein